MATKFKFEIGSDWLTEQAQTFSAFVKFFKDMYQRQYVLARATKALYQMVRVKSGANNLFCRSDYSRSARKNSRKHIKPLEADKKKGTTKKDDPKI
jgi:hypothetical protein